MLNTDLNIIMDYVRSSSGRATIAQMPRGYINFDAATLSGVTDGDLIGSAFGLPVKRSAALGNGKFAYLDSAGSTILTNV